MLTKEEKLSKFLKFWFGNSDEAFNPAKLYDIWVKRWFAKNEDAVIMDNCCKQISELISEYDTYDTDNLYHLVALVIIYDQLPRHVFKGTAEAYNYHAKALSFAKKIMNSKYVIPNIYYIPIIICYVHSENFEDQKYIKDFVQKFSLNNKQLLQSLSIIVNNHFTRVSLFGRIPERNRILSRTSTQKELSYLSELYPV